MVKILHLTRHLEIGGIPRHVVDLSIRLRAQGHVVSVASTGGAQVASLEAGGVKHLQIPLSSKFEFGPNLWISWLGVLPVLRTQSFDIVHAHTRIAQVLAGLIEKFHGIPAVSTCHGFFQSNLGRRLWPCWGQKVIAVSPAVQEHLVGTHRVSPESIVCIPNGINAGKYQIPSDDPHVSALKKELGLPSSTKVIGTTARLSPVKGLQYLLQAFSLCLKTRPNLTCLIVGDGPTRKELEDQAQKLQIRGRVIFTGAVEDVAPYLALMDVFVLPSLMEGLGLSILEAFAARKPVVASRVGGIVNVIKDKENGLLVEPRSPAEIARAIEQLLSQEKLCERLAQDALKTVESRFSLETMTRQVEQVYRSVKTFDSRHR